MRTLTALVVFGLMASSCGDGGSGGPPESTLTDAATAALEATGMAEALKPDSERVTITVESWRPDDQAIWDHQIIPVFKAAHPHINVVFKPTTPLEYMSALRTRLGEGVAGDLITCFPFDRSRELFEAGHLAPLGDLDGIEIFAASAQAAWLSADGATPYCVPVASIIQGFFYNVEVFNELGLGEPETESEFFHVLQAILADGTYSPIGTGLSGWEAEHILFQNIGANYWKGEEGRMALIRGEGRVTDQEYVDAFTTMARLGPYMHPEASGITYPDSKSLFETGQAAIYPGGSWEISGFDASTDFEFDVFRTPHPDGQETCYIVDHLDLAIGLNPASSNTDAARTFLSWVASLEFAATYTSALSGFFSLRDAPIAYEHPVARKFASWRQDCESTNRTGYEALDLGDPEFPTELREVSNAVILGIMTPQEAAKRLQDGLDSWYTPPMD